VLLVTRPLAAGQRLSAQLRAEGVDALWWPAFDLFLEPDPEARNVLAGLARFDLAILVSPMAARAVAALLPKGPGGRALWPRQTILAAVGDGTLEDAREAFEGLDESRVMASVIVPGSGASGSEGLLQELLSLPTPRRVLIARAQKGRELLAEELRRRGAVVEQLAVYRREAHVPSPERVAGLRAALGEPPAIVYTSTEAVGVVLAQLREYVPERVWPGEAFALCHHTRIANAATAAGHKPGKIVPLDASAIAQVLRLRRAPV